MEIEVLLERVGEMYYKFGIKSVTMDDISHEFGISKKTLYQYVEDKNDLVNKVVQHVYKTEAEKFKEFVCGDNNAIEELLKVNQYLRHMISNHNPSTEYDLKKYYPELYRTIKDKKIDQMYDNVLANLIKGKKEGLYRKELNEEFIAKYYVSRIDSSMDLYSSNENANNMQEYIYELFIYHIRGISSAKGIKFLEEHIDEIKLENHV